MRFIFFIISLILLNIAPAVAFAGVDCVGLDVNPAIQTVCDIIIFLQGRIGRAIATISVMMTAWEFSQGSIKWQGIVTAAVGLGMFFAPKTIALFVLPSYITGIVGSGYDPTAKYTPDQIITCACPGLV